MDKDKIIQNLKDAGCGNIFIRKFFQLENIEQLIMLAKHRTKLLDTLHKSQKQIDCLDFLIFDLKQKE